MQQTNRRYFRLAEGKSSTVALITLSILILVTGGVIYYAVNLSPVGWRQERSTNLPMKSETLATYLEDPSTCASDLDKLFDKVSLVNKKDTIYDIKLTDKDDKGLELHDVDLRIFIPRVPKIVQGDEFLTHLTLVQRELNRNDTIFRNTKYDDYNINVANNCLRSGLWEAYVNRRTGDDTGKIFHGWFEFPVPLYKKIFKEVNGFELEPHETAMQHYLRPDGKLVNMEHLRKVQQEKEIPLKTIDLNLEKTISRMGEQQHKAKLVINPGLHKYADIYEHKMQPIKLMQFDEPGIYKKKKVLKFDYSFFHSPEKVTLKKVRNDKLNKVFNEIEIEFPYGKKNVMIKNWPFMVNRNGLKLVLGGWTLDDIPTASDQPIPAADFGRFTFGVGTPDIYVTYEHRLERLNDDGTVYLFALDKDNKYVDNHTLGLDQIYISRLPDGTFVMYMVSYERIMMVAQWNFKMPEDILLGESKVQSFMVAPCSSSESQNKEKSDSTPAVQDESRDLRH